MGIQYDRTVVDAENGRDRGARIFCDACGEPIGLADSGVMAISGDGRVEFAHKGVCHDFIERVQHNEGRRAGWLDITDTLRQLARNHSDPPYMTISVAVERGRSGYEDNEHPDYEAAAEGYEQPGGQRERRLELIRNRWVAANSESE